MPTERMPIYKKQVNLFGEAVERKPSLSDRFLVPPFSVLDARQGYWMDRKRQWVKLGIRGEEGREAAISGAPLPLDRIKREQAKDELMSRYAVAKRMAFHPLSKDEPVDPMSWSKKKKLKQNADAALPPNVRPTRLCDGLVGERRWKKSPNELGDFAERVKRGEVNSKLALEMIDRANSGTSVFDPVLCELIYRWFCPPAGHILDPFAGESTKGIVATVLGFQYTGIELRQEQIDANRKQAKSIGVAPNWTQGDSAKLESVLPKRTQYDLIWTSPPYYDLEVYTEGNEQDGSAFQTYEQFMKWYYEIFRQAVARLADNRFCAVKVGEIRDRKTGVYRNFVGHNVSCFRSLGLHYYNEAVLVTPVGSLPVRAGGQFAAGRKLGRGHQNILVFVKGDPIKAAKACRKLDDKKESENV